MVVDGDSVVYSKINEWLQHSRRNDPLGLTDGGGALPGSRNDSTAVAMDLDRAMASLPGPVSLCIALSYHERLSHPEIESLTGLPIGTVKSHIRRGTLRLRELLSAYDEAETPEKEI